MKKYIKFIIVGLLSGILLFSCSNNNEEQIRTSKDENKSTSDPIDLITDDSYDVFNLEGDMELEIINRYTSDEADENGLVTLRKDGFEVSFGLIMVYNSIVDDKSLYILGEGKNTNNNGGAIGVPESEIEIDENRSLEDHFRTEFIAPDTESVFNKNVFLSKAEDNKVDSFKIRFKEPIDEDESSAVNDEEIQDWKTIEFHKK